MNLAKFSSSCKGIKVVFNTVFWDIFIGLYDIFENNQNHSEIDITVKHAYNVHTYNELMLTVKLFSFPVSFKHIVKVTDITN